MVKIWRVLSHPATKSHSILSMQKVKTCRAVSVPLLPLRIGPGSPAGIWGVFPSQKAAGNRQITVICVSSFSGRSVNLFHLGNNRLLAVPPAQTQAPSEQQEPKFGSGLATHFPLIIGGFPRALPRQTELPEWSLSGDQERRHRSSGKGKRGIC